MGCIASSPVGVLPVKLHGADTPQRYLSNEGCTENSTPRSFGYVMADELGREYFMKYLRSEHAEENLAFFQGVETLKGRSDFEMISSTQELVESYLKPGVETEVNISDNMKKNILKMVESRTTEEQLQELLKYLQIAQNEIFMIMSMGSFPRFSKSKLYQEYVRRAREEEVLREAVKALPNHHPLDRQGRATQTTEEMWLASFCKAVNNLPICVSIASTQRGACDVGFPLLHVNPFFEQTTGYSKAEVVGRNCKLLQAGKAEEESIARLSAALRQAAPVKVVITNVRKDGSLFRNLLALKPIMDDSGAYRYVVGVQFDVTQESATPAKLRLVDELLKMLTKNIPSGSNDSPNVKSPS